MDETTPETTIERLRREANEAGDWETVDDIDRNAEPDPPWAGWDE